MQSLDLPTLQIKKVSEKALMPKQGSEFAAGFDLHAMENVMVPARGKACIGTGLSMAIPYGNYGRIAPRSGLAAKHMIDVGAGVIDADYRGELKVLLFNLGDKDFEVKAEDRIAQLIIEKYTPTTLLEVSELPGTVRGEGGFGSTGIKANIDSKKRNIQEISSEIK